jgi:hypothetical protein
MWVKNYRFEFTVNVVYSCCLLKCGMWDIKSYLHDKLSKLKQEVNESIPSVTSR